MCRLDPETRTPGPCAANSEKPLTTLGASASRSAVCVTTHAKPWPSSSRDTSTVPTSVRSSSAALTSVAVASKRIGYVVWRTKTGRSTRSPMKPAW